MQDTEPDCEGLLGFGLTTSSILVKLLDGDLHISSFPWYKTDFEFSFSIKRVQLEDFKDKQFNSKS